MVFFNRKKNVLNDKKAENSPTILQKKSFLKKLFLLNKKNVCNDKRKKMPQQFDKKKLINKIVKISALQNFNLFTS